MHLGYVGATQRHSRAAGGGRTKLGEPPEVLSNSSQREFELGAIGPRKRSRPSRRMRLRWANSISTRFLSRRDCSNASVAKVVLHKVSKIPRAAGAFFV